MKKILQKLVAVLLLSVIFITTFNVPVYATDVNTSTANYELDFSDESKTILNEVFDLMKANNLLSEEERIDALTAYFLETPYVANRLIGSNESDEKLVIALNELDCFTYIDYVEAFKRSHDEASFINNLKKARYIDGEVTYLKRKHFFSDWYSENEIVAEDVLKQEQYKDVVDITTVSLNQGANGVYIPGLAVRERDIYSIPRDKVSEEILATLKTGDYVGLATRIAGLDVTHTVIVIQKEDGTYMRHASSQKANMKVVDEKLIDYVNRVSSVRGLLVFRSNQAMEPLQANLTMNYVDIAGNPVAAPTTKTFKYGETVNLSAPEIAGFRLDVNTKDQTVTMDDFNKAVNFVYAPVNTNGAYDIDFSDDSKTIMKDVFALMKENNLLSETERIDKLTAYFLDTPYVANRLQGSNVEKEKLVIALNELDCYTYIDYIEAFKRSTDETSFINNLIAFRYINKDVNYLTRKHFFSDWPTEHIITMTDVLQEEQYKDIVAVRKLRVNDAENRLPTGVWIPGLAIRERDVYYVPQANVTEAFLATLKTGDYVGMGTTLPGLDVTHTVIIIQKEDGTYMRHASSQSKNMKVVDEKLLDYVQARPNMLGILVFRSNQTMAQLSGDVTIEYVDTNGTTIKESTLETMLVGSEYEFTAPDIQGYVVSPQSQIITGKLTDYTQTIQFVYTKQTASEEQNNDDTNKETTDNATATELPTTGYNSMLGTLGLSSVSIGGLLLVIRKHMED